MVYKSLQNSSFNSLDVRRQKAVTLLFEDELTDEQIAKSVNRSRQTLSKWKNDPEFKKAQEEYRKMALDSYVPGAIKHLNHLALHSKSDMVQLQATQSILTMAGYGSVNSNVELDQAKARKANAEADITEYKAKVMTDATNLEDKTMIVSDLSDEDN